MRKNTSLVISVATPCHESWGKMTPTERGKFCQSCQKTVTDFSGMSDRQLIELINSGQGGSCGRFSPEQLNRIVSIPPQKKRRPLSVAAIVAALTIVSPSCKSDTANKSVQLVNYKDHNFFSFLFPGYKTISGIVKNDFDHSPLKKVSLRIKGQDNEIIVTDTSGRFELRVPDHFKEIEIVLICEYRGEEEVKLRLKENMPPIVIEINDGIKGRYAIDYGAGRNAQQAVWGKLKGVMKNIFG